MKKNLLIIILLLFTISFILPLDITYITGTKKEAKILKKAKPIYIVINYEKTLIYETNMYEYFEKQNIEAGTEFYNIKKMINDMKEACKEEIKKGKKWDLTLIDDQKEASEGFILYIVLDKIVSVPTIGYNAQYTIYCYKTGSKDLIFKAQLEGATIGKGITEKALKMAGEILGERLVDFLKTL